MGRKYAGIEVRLDPPSDAVRGPDNPARFGPTEGDMDPLMLDGNAVAGLLQEVFAVEMTSAMCIPAAAGVTRWRRPRCG